MSISDEQLLAIYDELNAYAMSVDKYEFGLPSLRFPATMAEVLARMRDVINREKPPAPWPPSWICRGCETPELCFRIQGCDREEINR